MTEFWGLTGGIASGKSTVAQYFFELGVPVLDADQISGRLSLPDGKAYDEITRRFGAIDRETLRNTVFNDEKARKDLEAILHPHIIRESDAQMERIKNALSPPVIIYEATLLVETKRYEAFSGLIVVESPRELRKERLLTRSGFSETLVEKILSSQITDEKRREAATLVIQNSGSLEELKNKVREISLARHWISS